MVALNENGEYQRTFTIDKEGNKQYNNIIFNYGTIESQNSISYYNQKQNKKDTYDEYKIRGDIYSSDAHQLRCIQEQE